MKPHHREKILAYIAAHPEGSSVSRISFYTVSGSVRAVDVRAFLDELAAAGTLAVREQPSHAGHGGKVRHYSPADAAGQLRKGA